MEEKTCGGESREMRTGMGQLLRWFGIALIVISMLGPAFAPVSYGVEANSAEDSKVKTVKITTKPASGQINRRTGVVVRKSASSRSKKVARLPSNKKITMEHMTFTTTKNYSRKQRWFYIRCGSVKGYVPVNQVDHVRYQYRKVKAKKPDIPLRRRLQDAEERNLEEGNHTLLVPGNQGKGVQDPVVSFPLRQEILLRQLQGFESDGDRANRAGS